MDDVSSINFGKRVLHLTPLFGGTKLLVLFSDMTETYVVRHPKRGIVWPRRIRSVFKKHHC